MHFPIINDLKSYSTKKLGYDILTALTVTVILIPQGMAYAVLAGLPPIYGLYGALVPMIVYPIFATSREVSVGPMALISIILFSGVSVFAEPGSQEYIDMILMTALISGLIQLVFSIFKLGILSNFLSRPVMDGFISAAGVIIIVSQLEFLLSLELSYSSYFPDMLLDIFIHLSETNIYALLLGMGGIIIILLLQKVHKAIPGALIMVVIGSVLLYYLKLDDHGVAIVGALPKNLPNFYSGFWNIDYLIKLFPTSFTISIICFIGSYSLAKTLAGEKGNYPIDANKELLGLGMAKIFGSFFFAMPATGSLSRSAINAQMNIKSGLSSVFVALFVGLTIAFFGSLFFYLPEPVLAAIVISSVIGLIRYKKAVRLFYVDRRDFWILIATFLLTLFLGIVNGILSGIALSLLSIILRSSVPHYAILGKLPNTTSYRNIERYTEAKTTPDVLVIRYDHDLFFGNAEHFYHSVIKELNKKPSTEKLILHIGSIHNLDSSALYKIHHLIDHCNQNNIRLIFTNISGPIRDLFHKTGLSDKLGAENIHLNVAHALSDEAVNRLDQDLSQKYASQTNEKKK